jgi:hypothetical protein
MTISALNAREVEARLAAATAQAANFIYKPDARLEDLFPLASGDAELLDAIFEVYEAFAVVAARVQ